MNRTFKAISFAWIALLSAALLSSCSDAPKTADAKEKAEEHNDVKFDGNSVEADAQFLVDAYSAGLCEIEAAKHAKEKATTKEIKEIADAMIKDHVQLNESIKALATKKQVSLQEGLTEDQMNDIRECGKKSGAEYNKAYLEKTIEGHEKSVKLYEKAADKATDPAIRDLASKALPELRHHADMVLSAKEKIKA